MTGSWVPVPTGSDFPIENLPFGTFRRRGEAGHDSRLGVAIGEYVLDLRLLAYGGLVPHAHVLTSSVLNPLLAEGRAAWSALRARVRELLTQGNTEMVEAGLAASALVPQSAVVLTLPFAPGDYVDFYSSLEHATNMGLLFRPGDDALAPNWRHLPVGYHGRAGSVVVSGTPIRRPHGQRRPPDSDQPVFGPTTQLDIEVELGFLVGDPNPVGSTIPADRAADHLFGVVLVNDWSARDIQAWEYQPLGPFLGKSFATTVSPWVVPFEALEPYRVAAPVQVPQPLPHLQVGDRNWALDIELSAEIQTASMREAGIGAVKVTQTNARRLYWTMPQQLAHAASNGAAIRPGDLFATGAISGIEPGSYGSLIELTWGGRRALELPGTARTFLEDGDTVVIRGWCGGDDRPRIGFGRCEGRIERAPA